VQLTAVLLRRCERALTLTCVEFLESAHPYYTARAAAAAAAGRQADVTQSLDIRRAGRRASGLTGASFILRLTTGLRFVSHHVIQSSRRQSDQSTVSSRRHVLHL